MSRVSSPICLIVPACLSYREVLLRTALGACRLVAARAPLRASEPETIDLSERFDASLVSAVSEIFNNIVLHGHAGGNRAAEVTIVFAPGRRCLEVHLRDAGQRFDDGAIPQPDLRTLPEQGMGLFIARSSVDRLEYRPGPPNQWHLTKCLAPDE